MGDLGVPHRRRRRPWAFLIVSTFLLSGLCGDGDAHALLARSTPQNGATLSRAPDGVLLVFTEEPEPALSSVQVLDASGRPVAGGAPQPVRGRPLELRVPLPRLPDGPYTVTWRTVSRIDGHVAAGVFSFGVGVVPSATQPPQALNPPPSPSYVLSHLLLYLGVCGLLAIAVAGAALPSLTFTLRQSLWPTWTAAAGGLVLLAVAQARDAGTGLGRLMGTPLGHALWWRALPIAAAAVAARVTFVGGRGRRRTWVAVAIWAALAMLAHAVAGHAGGDAGVRRLWNILDQWAHFAAIGVWAGGLLALWLEGRARDVQQDAAIGPRLSLMAAGALVVAGATGALRAADEVAAWPILISTAFGTLVLLKATLFVVLALVGACARRLTSRRAQGRPAPLDLIVPAEMAVAVGALAVTAYLTGLPVPRAAEGTAAAPAIIVTGSDYATSVRVRLLVAPALPGTNHFSAEITDYDTHRPVVADRVTLRFTKPDRADLGPSSLLLLRNLAGLYQGKGSNISLDGRWAVVVVVERQTQSVAVPLELTIARSGQTVRTIRAPGRLPIYVVDLSRGRTLSIYLDPGKAGFNALHGTLVDAQGHEVSLARAPEITAGRVGAQPRSLPAVLEGPGHFTSGADFGPGEWQLELVATTRSGETLRAQLTVGL